MCALPPDQDHPGHLRPSVWSWLTALLIWSTMLFVLSLLPADSVSTSFPFEISDKIQHFSAYTVLTLLLACTLTAWRGVSDSLLLVTAIGAFAYGLLIEALQELMQLGRSAEWGDQLANTLGILFSCVVFRHVARRFLVAGSDR